MNDRYLKWGAVGAIAYPVIQLISQGLIQFGGREPTFNAPAAEILAFFQNRNPAFTEIAGYLSALSVIAFLWFTGALWRELHKAEGEPGWISFIAAGSGLVTAAAFNSGGWELALFRVNEGLDPQVARLLFDEGNLNFATTWISNGSMLLAAGIVFRGAGTYPKWLGWGSIILAVGLFLARALWTTQIAFLPYVLLWAWMIGFGIFVLRRSQVEASSSKA